MAGRPPTITEIRIGGGVKYSFNECPSVPRSSVVRASTALKRAKLLPANTIVQMNEGRIEITIPIPPHIPTDRRMVAYVQWARTLRCIIHSMIICIQSEREPKEVIRYVSEAAKLAA